MTLLYEKMIDRHRPIAFDGVCFTRVDTSPLRELQGAFNALVHRICTSPNTGNQVLEATKLLRYLLDTEFCTRGTLLISAEIVKILISIRKVGNDPDEYMDTSGVLNALLRVSEAINTGKISLDQLYDRIPEARDTDPIATLFAMHGATLKE
jgi:hypothetical protein